MKIDLHMHSTASDGKLSPKELIDLAIERKLEVIAITDHDVISGLKEADEYAKEKNFEFVPGVEIGADELDLGVNDIHIVGLFIDYENDELKKIEVRNLQERENQKVKIIEKLNELGYEITFDELKIEAGGPNYGRPHVARILMKKYSEEFPDMQKVFDELLATGAKAYVCQVKDDMKTVIDLIHNSGGVAILAHPAVYGREDLIERIVERFVEGGGDGIEISYPYEIIKKVSESLDEKIELIKELARKYDLLVSGGTDFHSFKSYPPIGEFGITKDDFNRLKNKIN